jgi:hypothetical protein
MAPRPYEIPEGGATVLVQRATRRGLPALVGVDAAVLGAVGVSLHLYPVQLHAFSFQPDRAVLLLSVSDRPLLWRFTGRVFKRIGDAIGGGAWTARSHVQVLDPVRCAGAVAWVHARPGIDSTRGEAELSGYGISLEPLLADCARLRPCPSTA